MEQEHAGHCASRHSVVLVRRLLQWHCFFKAFSWQSRDTWSKQHLKLLSCLFMETQITLHINLGGKKVPKQRRYSPRCELIFCKFFLLFLAQFCCILYIEKYTNKIMNIGLITPVFNHFQALYWILVFPRTQRQLPKLSPPHKCLSWLRLNTA